MLLILLILKYNLGILPYPTRFSGRDAMTEKPLQTREKNQQLGARIWMAVVNAGDKIATVHCVGGEDRRASKPHNTSSEAEILHDT